MVRWTKYFYFPAVFRMLLVMDLQLQIQTLEWVERVDVASEKTPEMMDAFVGIVLTKGGEEAPEKLTEIAGEMKDSPARTVLLERLKVWTTKDEFQVN